MINQYGTRVFLLLLSFYFIRSTTAQNIHLVKDINFLTHGNPSNLNSSSNSYSFRNTTNFAEINGVSYFGADDGLHGVGLWRSDGTTEGTYQVKDSISPAGIISSNGKLFFRGLGTTGLWTSDGTRDGTVPVLNSLPAGLTSFVPANLTDLNGTVFFSVSKFSGKNQLWKTDGTQTGTVLVKDFYSPDFNTAGANLANFTVVRGKLYFTVESYTTNNFRSKLWVSDGSASGTFLMSNSLLDPAQIFGDSSDPVNPRVYFSAISSPTAQRSLYFTNGDTAVVQAANGFSGIISHHNGFQIINKEGVIYFIGRENSSAVNQNLYKFDLSGAYGVQPVKQVTGRGPSGGYAGIIDLVKVNGNIFFELSDTPNGKYQLWKTDGSAAGNVLLKDSLFSSDYAIVNGLLFFSGLDQAHGRELWKSDGTASGTVIVKDIASENLSSNPSALTSVNNKLLFAARDYTIGVELWLSDGTAGGTSLVKDINKASSYGSDAINLTPFNNGIIFAALEGNGEGYRLWKTDGTTSGTEVVNDTIFKRNDPVDKLTVRNNEAYFWGYSKTGRQGLYKTNGTAAGTILVKDFTGSLVSFYRAVATDSLVYFYLYSSPGTSYELWRTDGTNENTYKIKGDFKGVNLSENMFASVGSTLFFLPYNSKSLWKTDGTVEGTIQLKTFPNDPANLAAHKGTLFFSCYNDESTQTLWKSDGTAQGTIQFTNKVASPSAFTSSNGELYFTATGNPGPYENIGRELFKTDGTENGTVLVQDIHPGIVTTNVYAPHSANGLLYFFTNGSAQGSIELWKSDGTNAGTQLISQVSDGFGGPPNKIVSGNGKLFFIVNKVLWESDGTQTGTHAVSDNILPTINIESYNASLTSTGVQLFFVADNYQYGREVYAGYISNAIVLNYTSAANGNWNDPATWAGYVVPPPGANVVILHNVVANINATCNGLRVEVPGGLTVNEGVRITLLQ